MKCNYLYDGSTIVIKFKEYKVNLIIEFEEACGFN